MNVKNRLKWLVNGILFIIFLISYFLDLTGVVLHQWLGLIVGIITLLHLLNHWQWVKAVTQRFFQSTSNSSRFNYLLDASLAIGMAAIILSGLVISTWFGIFGSAYEVWRFLHVLVSIVSLVILLVKLFLHWKCIAGAFKQVFTLKPAVLPQTFSPLNCEDPKAVSRRDALRTMGVISLAGVVVLAKAMTSLKIPEAGGTPLEMQDDLPVKSVDFYPPSTGDLQSSQPASVATSVPNTKQAASNCVVRCPNNCSYPGRCRRYTDVNNNGRCDLGECL